MCYRELQKHMPLVTYLKHLALLILCYLSVLPEQDVITMAIGDAQDIGGDTVTSTRQWEPLHGLLHPETQNKCRVLFQPLQYKEFGQECYLFHRARNLNIQI